VQLKEIESTMVRAKTVGDYKKMPTPRGDRQSPGGRGDRPGQEAAVDRLREFAYEARTVLDFEKTAVVGGVV
jgi:hypothetical protein